MVSERLRDVMLAADGAGALAGDDVRHGAATHPVCGDEVELFVRLDGRAIRDLGWLAAGCPATMAVTALARSALVGAPIDDAEARLHAAITELGGLARQERHAAAIVLRALAMAGGNDETAAR